MSRKIDVLERGSHLTVAKATAARHLAQGEWEKAIMSFVTCLAKHSELAGHPLLPDLRRALAEGRIEGVIDAERWLEQFE